MITKYLNFVWYQSPMSVMDTIKIIVNITTISNQDELYIAASDVNDLREVERIRRRLLKYKTSMGDSWPKILDSPTAKLVPPTNIRIDRNSGRLHIQTPFDEDFIHRIKRIKGRIWDGTYNTIPFENAIAAIKVIETVFNTYIEIDVPEVVWAGIGMDETLRAIKIAIFVNNDIIRKTLQKFGARYDSFSITWNVFISSPEQLDGLIDHLRSYPKIFKFISVTNERIAKFRAMISIDAKNKSELFHLSKTAEIDTGIRCPDGLTPYPFQIVGVRFIEKTNGCTLIADDMGLGKTIQALLYLYNHSEALPCIIVVPSCVKIKWFRETKKWLSVDDDSIALIAGTNSRGDDDMPTDKRVYIMNYEVANGRFAELLGIPYKTIIIDEAHYIKNQKAKRTKAVLEICKRSEHVICLTGTPIVNKPVEMWSILMATKNSHHFGGFMDYVLRYCAAFKSRFGWDYGGASHLDELYHKLREIVMIRRKKSQVLDQLPAKQRIVIPVQITNRTTYNRAMTDFRRWYKEKKNKDLKSAESAVKIEALRQLTYKGKQDAMIDFIINAHENDGKVIVFSYHVELTDLLIEKLTASGIFVRKIIHGMSDTERQQQIDEFNECHDGIIVCSLKVGSVGIDLQSAHTVIFTEFGWSPSEHIQAEDRAHRIGQTESVTVYYIVGIDTIDEDSMDIIEEKQRNADQMLDSDMTSSMFKKLEKRLSNTII